MARYIDEEELIKSLFRAARFKPEAYNEIINYLTLKPPAADVQEVKHGKWEHKIQEMGIFKHHYIVCPCCDDWFNIVNVHLLIGDGKLFDFCPNCGAKMDGESDKE